MGRWSSFLGRSALAATLGVLVGAGTHTFYFAHGASYLSNDPSACVNCHVMRQEYDGWQKASHHATATCNDCHVPHDFLGKWTTKALNGWNHSKAFTLQNFHEPIEIHAASSKIVQDNCLRCHGDFVSEITAYHNFRGETVDCVRCHDAVGHGSRG